MLRLTGWDRKFDEPVPLRNGRTLVTLREAALYITKLTEAERDAEEWQARWKRCWLRSLTGPPMFARIGVLLALNRHVDRVFDSSRKDHHWGRRKLARDR
jgi:hypothetical protein